MIAGFSYHEKESWYDTISIPVVRIIYFDQINIIMNFTSSCFLSFSASKIFGFLIFLFISIYRDVEDIIELDV